MKDLYTERYNRIAEHIASDKYRSLNALQKVEELDNMNQLFNSAIEVEDEGTPYLKSYSKKVLNAIQEIYEQRQD